VHLYHASTCGADVLCATLDFARSIRTEDLHPPQSASGSFRQAAGKRQRRIFLYFLFSLAMLVGIVTCAAHMLTLHAKRRS
jgi:hypothetical protein